MSIVCYDSNDAVINQLYQWDIDRKIHLVGDELTGVSEIHMTNKGQRRAVRVEYATARTGIVVTVPNFLLRNTDPLVIYLYQEMGGTEERTVYELQIPIVKRAMPVGYIDSEAWSGSDRVFDTIDLDDYLLAQEGSLRGKITVLKVLELAGVDALADRVSTIEGKEPGWDAKYDANTPGGIPIDALSADTQLEIYAGRQAYDALSGKQDRLTAGENITIENNVISAQGGANVTPYDEHPQMDGTASAGSSTKYARGDHRHPTDTALAGRIATIEGKEGGWNAKWGSGTIGEIPITALESTAQILIMRGAQAGADAASALAGLGNKVDKVTGKELSTNDYDSAAKAKVDAIPANPQYTDTVYDDTALANRVTTLEAGVVRHDVLQTLTTAQKAQARTNIGAGTYSKPSGGIPASDLASGVIPSVPVQSVNGQTGTVVLDAADVGAEPAVTEITISSAGAVTQECADNTIYTFTGALTSLTLTQATGAREYLVIFTTGSTAPTVTFPSGVAFPDTLTIEANKRYEVSVRDGYAVVQSWAVSA